MDHEPAQDLNARPASARIELSHADLAVCQLRSSVAATPVTLHWTNWPGKPSRPCTVLYGDPAGNIMFSNGKKLSAMPDELTTIPRAGLEVSDVPGDPARIFTPARMAQGFRDQAHLDAFYVYYDHVQAGRAAGTSGCGCGQPGPATETTDGGVQPSETVCQQGMFLFLLAGSPNEGE